MAPESMNLLLTSIPPSQPGLTWPVLTPKDPATSEGNWLSAGSKNLRWGGRGEQRTISSNPNFWAP